MSYLVIFGLKYEKGIVIFEITSKFLKAKLCAKMKILKSRTKNALLGRQQFLKTIVIFKISALEFVLGNFVNLGIRSAFSKGPESTFSEGPGQLYKGANLITFIYHQYEETGQ